MINTKFLKKKAINGILVFGIRRVLIQLIQTTANVILARILFPEDFGVYAIILLLISIFTLICDLGLTVGLVQSREEPTVKQLRTIFSTHLLLGMVATALMFSLASVFNYFTGGQLGQNSIFLLKLASLSLIFFNFRLISFALLERNLHFNKMVVEEVIELAIFEGIVIVLALLGFGVASFIWGMVASRLIGSLIYFILFPWKLGLRFSINDLKPFLKFGIPFQLNSLVGSINGAVTPIVVGGLVGTKALGLVTWAGGVGSFPKSASDIVARAIFPIIARSQHNQKLLISITERAIHFTNLITFPLVVIMIILAEPITYIVFTDKWKEAIPALYFFTFQSVFMAINQVLTFVLLALGKSKIIASISFASTVLIWILAIILVKTFGFLGIAVASLMTCGILIILLKELKKLIPINLLSCIVPYIPFTIILVIGLFLYIARFPIHSLLELILAVIFGAMLYGIPIFIIRFKIIKEDMLKIYHLFK